MLSIDMKRAVLCVKNPQNYINDLDDYSIMIVNPDSAPARLDYLLTKSDYSLLITDQTTVDRNGQDYPGERVLWYTSGTTGDSKFCSFTQAQLDALSKTIIDAYNITDNDRYVGIMPLWHAHGQGFYWATQLAKCETHFISTKDVRTMPRYSPTFITAIPDLLKVIGQLNFDKNLRFFRSASASLPDQLFQDLKNKFTLPVIEAFGMTEALSHCFTNPLYGEQRMGTIGLPSGIRAEIKNGQLHIQGTSVVTSDWYNTGDLIEQDEKGYYRLLGRVNDRIIVKGYKIDPISIERQLQEKLPNIGECVIFGKERVNCIYTGSITLNEVADCLIGIHLCCRPVLVEQMEIIPLPSNGKLSRTWLKEQFKCQ